MSNNAPRVFVTQENTQLNYSNAEAFGEVVFLTRDEVSPVPGSLTNKAIMHELRDKLESFDFEVDYLAPSGSPVVSGMAFAVLAEQAAIRYYANGVPKPNLCVLRWSNRDRLYQPISINLQQ